MIAYVVNNHSIEFVGETKKDIQKKIYDYLVAKELDYVSSDIKSIDVSMDLKVDYTSGRHEIIVINNYKDGTKKTYKHGLTFAYEENPFFNMYQTIYKAK
jgi:hypothetical protein